MFKKSEQVQQQQFIWRNNRKRQKIVRNKLIFVSILNLLTFLCFVFSMSYYKWVHIKFQRTSLDTKEFNFWVNLLFIKEDVDGSQYERFSTAAQRVCLNNVYCQATFYELFWIGLLCFGILLVAGLLQAFQVFKIIYYIVRIGKIVESKKNFENFLTIFTYALGLSLNGFSNHFIMQNQQYYYGLSYWFCVCLLVTFVFVIIYGQYSIRKMQKQALIQNLIDREKTYRCQNILKQGRPKSSNISSSQVITL